MFITEDELRKRINSLLTEGQRTDAFAGEMSQVIVTSAAAYCMRIFMRSTSQKKKSPRSKFELDFNFSKSAAQNIALNKTYDISFLMNPQTPADKARREDYLKSPNITTLIKRMMALHRKHNGVMTRLQSALESRAEKLENKPEDLVPTRMHEEIALEFSGRVKAIINMDFSHDNNNFINGNLPFSGGAHVDQTTGDMQVSLFLPKDFMDFFSNRSSMQIKNLYKAFEIAKGHLKGAISHELTHITQRSGFDERRRNRQSRTGNRVEDYVNSNAAYYSPIDADLNPLLAKLYNHLGDTLKRTFSGGSGFMDINMLQSGNHGNSNAQQDFKYFDLLIRHFAPEEIEAYVRGHRTDAISSDYLGLQYTGAKRSERLYFLFEDRVQQRMNSFLPPRRMFLPERISNHIRDLGINYQSLRKEAIDSYLNAYDQLFFREMEDPSQLQRQPKTAINPPRTQAVKLADAIDSQASLEFRTDPQFENSIQYMKDELRNPQVDQMMLDQIKQMIRSAGYEIRTGSGKMGNRIFKRK